MKDAVSLPRWLQIVLMLFVPIVGYLLGLIGSLALNISRPFDNLVVNLGFLVDGCDHEQTQTPVQQFQEIEDYPV